MPQLQLPIFLEGVNPITPELGYLLEGSQVTYLHGMLPVFTHEETDTASFKMITSQFYVSGTAKQAQNLAQSAHQHERLRKTAPTRSWTL